MPFDRTYRFSDYDLGYRYSQGEGLCYAHCLNWMTAALEGGDPKLWFQRAFTKQYALNNSKVLKLLKWADMLDGWKAELRKLQFLLQGTDVDAQAWGKIRGGTHFQVTSMQIVSSYGSTGVSSYLPAWTHALVGWDYDNRGAHNYVSAQSQSGSLDMKGINHQCCYLRSPSNPDKTMYFDPNAGHFEMDTRVFGSFFDSYFDDVVQNKESAGKSFYSHVTITGIKVTS